MYYGLSIIQLQSYISGLLNYISNNVNFFFDYEQKQDFGSFLLHTTVIKKGSMLLSIPVRLEQRDSQFVWAGLAEPTQPIGLYCCCAASTEWSVPTMNVR